MNQKRTIYNLTDIVGKTVKDVRNYQGLIAIHFESGPPLLLTGTIDQGVVWTDILCGQGAEQALMNLDLQQ